MLMDVDEELIISFCEFDRAFFELSNKWLNEPTIKKLTMAPSTTREQRLCWFETLKTRDDYRIEGIKVNGIPIGALGIKRIDYKEKTGEYFGYIGECDYIGKGLGKEMVNHAFSIAKNIGLNSLYLKVSNTNERAIRLYLKMGFVKDYCENEIICMKVFI